MFVTTEITIDFQRPRQNTIQVVQDDTTRKIRLVLKNGGNDYDITSDLESGETWVGAVAYLKPDGHGGVYDTTEDGDTAVQLVSDTTNQFDVLLVGQVFTAAGWTQINIKFYNADLSKVLSTFAIDVNVQRNAASDYESEDYSNMQSLGAIRTEITEFEATVRAELLALKADTEQDVTDAYIAAAQETPGLTYEQFFMTLPTGFYRIVWPNPPYTYHAQVDNIDPGGERSAQRLVVSEISSYGEARVSVYSDGQEIVSYEETPDGIVHHKPLLVSTPENPQQAANKRYVDTKGGLSDEAKDALLDCFTHVAWTDEHGQDYYDALEAALYPPADLVSISAVFEQGQTVVYDTDSLDVLKPMLTVTAHYSDATSETVSAYTLSGTLTEGTSVVTVSYGGKTTTFNVVVQSNTITIQSGMTRNAVTGKLESVSNRTVSNIIPISDNTVSHSVSVEANGESVDRYIRVYDQNGHVLNVDARDNIPSGRFVGFAVIILSKITNESVSIIIDGEPHQCALGTVREFSNNIPVNVSIQGIDNTTGETTVNSARVTTDFISVSGYPRKYNKADSNTVSFGLLANQGVLIKIFEYTDNAFLPNDVIGTLSSNNISGNVSKQCTRIRILFKKSDGSDFTAEDVAALTLNNYGIVNYLFEEV